MHQVIRQRPIVICAISLGLMTAHVSLLQSIPCASAQQLTGPAHQGNNGIGSQGRRIESLDPTLLYPTKSLERKDTQTLTYKPHRLIRKPQNAPVASVEPSPSSSSSISSLPPPSMSLQNDNTISQSKEPSSFTRSAGPTVPLATVSVAPTSVTTSGATAAGTVSTGTTPLAAAGSGNSSASGNGNIGGRSMSKLAAEMPGLAQLMSPASTFSAPPPTINPAIGASPTALSFTATQGGANPANQTVTISNTGGGTLNWSASEPAAWLTLSPASGTGNGAVTLSATTGTLTANTYTTTVTLSGGSGVTPVPVTFTIAAAPVPPAIGASPTALSFTATQGGANPANQTVTISNTGGGTLNWSAGDSVTWLSLSPASGTGTGMVTVSVAIGTLTAGSYSGAITVSATGTPSVTVPVTFAVTATPTINLSPSSLSFTATQGAANPTSQTVSITNTGGTLSWSASDNASWLSVTPGSGSSTGTLSASVNTAGLNPGTYNGTITVAAVGTTSKTVGVTLTVNLATTSSATLTWNPNTESDLAGYKVYRATASGAYGVPVATLSGNVTSYVSAGLQVGTTYYFVVTAYDSAGNESPRSAEVSRSIF